VALDTDDAAYLPFLVSGDDRETPSSCIEVEVVPDPIPPNDSPVLYDHDGTWEFRRDGEGYCLTMRSRDDGRALLAAYCDECTTRIRVYTGGPAGLAHSSEPRLSRTVLQVLDGVLLMNHLAPRGGLTVHAAGAVVNGEGLVFAGVSTAGKSTVCGLLMDSGLEDPLLSDDRLVLRPAEGDDGGVMGMEMWGTPWCGDPQVARNAGHHLTAIFFLAKASVTDALPLAASEAMRCLMPLVSGPWYDRQRGDRVLETCGRIAERIPCYELRFRPDEEVVTLLKGRSWGPPGKPL
jgi:hypothetical protein